MSFNIYSIPSDQESKPFDELSDDSLVESGLSSGEVRQSLLDRFREELKTEDTYFVNFALEAYDLQFDVEEIETPEGQETALKAIDDLLYSLEDEALSCTLWDFHNETVYLKDEE